MGLLHRPYGTHSPCSTQEDCWGAGQLVGPAEPVLYEYPVCGRPSAAPVTHCSLWIGCWCSGRVSKLLLIVFHAHSSFPMNSSCALNPQDPTLPGRARPLFA